MNNSLNQFIIQLFNKKDFIDDWLSHKYKEKSLAIYGPPGIGKSTLADYILKDWVKIYIRNDFCKNNINFNDYLKDSLYKKSITMMFNNNIYKALIIDDIYYIQNNDKKLFKSIINFVKQKLKNHPIIYILNSTYNKNIKLIIQKCFPFKIDYSFSQLVCIVKKFFLNNTDDDIIKSLVNKSNNNLHNIIVNIDFYNTNVKNIHCFDTIEEDLSLHIKNIINIKDFINIYNHSYTDYNIIGLNILENIHVWINKDNKLNDKEKIILIQDIYHSFSISDKLLNKVQENNQWTLIEHIITYSIVHPIVNMRINKINIEGDIPYNKYISKCII